MELEALREGHGADGVMATQGPLGSWPPPTWEGLGDLLVPGILPANQGLLPSSAALGQHQAHHSPARLALGTRLPPVYRQPPPPVRVTAARGVGEG